MGEKKGSIPRTEGIVESRATVHLSAESPGDFSIFIVSDKESNER